MASFELYIPDYKTMRIHTVLTATEDDLSVVLRGPGGASPRARETCKQANHLSRSTNWPSATTVSPCSPAFRSPSPVAVSPPFSEPMGRANPPCSKPCSASHRPSRGTSTSVRPAGPVLLLVTFLHLPSSIPYTSYFLLHPLGIYGGVGPGRLSATEALSSASACKRPALRTSPPPVCGAFPQPKRKQRVLIARALATKPDIPCNRPPTAGVDSAGHPVAVRVHLPHPPGAR